LEGLFFLKDGMMTIMPVSYNGTMNMERLWINQLQTRWPQVDLRHDTFYDANSRQILTTDMMVEGVHFSWEYFMPQDLGWRCIAMNLSDIAATGGKPCWVLVSIGIPEDRGLDLLEGIYQGIEDCCQKFKCTVVGGDTVRAKETVISVTLVANLPRASHPGRRNTAKPGDLVAISGLHGLSRAGMEALKQNLPNYKVAKAAHLRPVPQLRLGEQIAQVQPRYAMMDSSDGLADALLRLAEASVVDMRIDLNRLQIHPEVAEIAAYVQQDPMDWLLYGGEDFQLVVTMPPETISLFPELIPIGYVQPVSHPEQPQVLLKQHEHLRPLTSERVFQHFSVQPEDHPVWEETSWS
jgi:thiamine-monophosphate kinase